MSELGQKAKYSLRADVFRFTPESGLKSDITACPKSARKRLMHCTNFDKKTASTSMALTRRWRSRPGYRETCNSLKRPVARHYCPATLNPYGYYFSRSTP